MNWLAERHWSSCAINGGPAYWPMPCNCGGVHEQGSRPKSRGPAVVLRRFLALWRARWIWKQENNESLGGFLRQVAMREIPGRGLR